MVFLHGLYGTNLAIRHRRLASETRWEVWSWLVSWLNREIHGAGWGHVGRIPMISHWIKAQTWLTSWLRRWWNWMMNTRPAIETKLPGVSTKQDYMAWEVQKRLHFGGKDFRIVTSNCRFLNFLVPRCEPKDVVAADLHRGGEILCWFIVSDKTDWTCKQSP